MKNSVEGNHIQPSVLSPSFGIPALGPTRNPDFVRFRKNLGYQLRHAMKAFIS